MSKVVSITTRPANVGSALGRRIAVMPSTPGMRTSIRTMSGRSVGAFEHRLVPVGRLTDDVDIGVDLEDDPETCRRGRLVVDDQDADRGEAASSGGAHAGCGGQRRPPARSHPWSTLGRPADLRRGRPVPASPQPVAIWDRDSRQERILPVSRVRRPRPGPAITRWPPRPAAGCRHARGCS